MKLLCTCLLLFVCGNLFAQNHTITGIITDQNATPVPNATIIVKGTKTGTASNADGTFSLTIAQGANTLVISSVNFITREVDITDSTSVAVSLQPSSGNLSEVVVVAYGAQKKLNVTGAISTIKGGDLADKPFSSIDKTLQGLAPGVQSTSASGAPGSATNVRIRGIGSINASAAPLWVIDGVVATIGDLSSATTTANALSGLNPDDIESITVLKDAAATSIYGSRAANGVILITTKKGKAGKTILNVAAEAGANNIAYYNDNNRSLTSVETQTLLREALINVGYVDNNKDADQFAIDYLGLPKDYTKTNTDWYKVVTQTGQQHQYNLSLTGGTDKTQFYTSAGFFRQEGTVIASDFKRYNGSFSLTHKPNEKITFTTGINGSFSQQHTPTNSGFYSNPVISSYFLLPWYTPYNKDGSLRYGDNDADNEFPDNAGPFNPLVIASFDKNTLRQINMRGYVSGEYNILPSLKFSSRYSAEFLTIQEDVYNNPIYGDGQATEGFGIGSNRRVFDWTWTNLLDYKHTLNADGDVYFDIYGGYESQYYNNYILQSWAQVFPGNLNLQYLSVAATPVLANSLPDENATASYLSNLTFNYKDKYVITGSFRRDGSSVFGANNRWGNFYSVGGTWNLSEEAFLQKSNVINLLKLRASYGENGNSLGFGEYQSLATYNFGHTYQSLVGSAPENVGDSNLTWEKNKIFDAGLDFALFKNRFTGSFDFYNRSTSGLLIAVPFSGTSGFGSQLYNVGSIRNNGFEIALGGKPVIAKDFTWDVQFNFAYNKNRVLDLYKHNPIPSGSIFNITEGHDVQEFYMPLWAGVDPANGDPLWYTDASHSATTNDINNAPTLLTGKSASPKYFGSFTNTFTYKGFSLSAQLYYNYGNYVFDNWDFYDMSDGAYITGLNQFSSQLTRWQKPGDHTNVPKIIFGGNKNSNSVSSRFLYDGSYVRLRDVQVSYNFSKTLLQKWNINNASVYVRGTNLLTFTKDKYLPLDPETGIQSVNDFDVFIPKTIVAGVKLGF